MTVLNTMTKRIVLLFSICSIVGLQADDAAEGRETRQAGSRGKALQAHAAMQESRAAEEQADSSEDGTPSEADLEQQAIASHNLKSLASPKSLYYYSSHPGAIHQVISVWQFLDKIELEDGSIWSIYSGDRWKVADWSTSDVILILPNHNFFSIFSYILYNQSTNDYVAVNLSEMEVTYDPSFGGMRHWVIGFDDSSRVVYLEDGSIWAYSSSDDYVIRSWAIGDVVIIGVNDGSSASKRPNILINFDTLTSTKANCIY